MNVRDLRKKYLEFFESKGHMHFPSGSLIPYDVTGRLDESLLFNGAGMIQFKPYFRGTAQPENKLLTTAQKCVRTGDIEEVGDDTHLTFFEMMGNFSFGGYFKEQAVAYSWEFLTTPAGLNLDAKKLAFTIYEDDDETYGYWSRILTSAGLDPATRIFRLDEETNYWPAGSFTKGPPGPCGPNSEMFYWTAGDPPTGPYSREDFLRDDSAGNWVEIWNDVFITYEWQGKLKNAGRPAEGYIKEGMPELPFRSIDTGMGLERTAMVLGGFKSVYDLDVFAPILNRIRSLSPDGPGSEQRVLAERVIADHIRTSSFCIADGVFPSNNGRGYVLRRLIRRAVLKGQRVLGLNKPFFAEVFQGVVEAMGDFYTELGDRRETIEETLRNEEAQFRRTLSAGTSLLEQELSGLGSGDVLAGDIAFRLYDTYGFPLEVTQEIAQESGIAVDLDGYESALKEAQERSRSGQERDSVYGALSIEEELATEDAPATTKFLGYADCVGSGTIVRVRPDGPARWKIALDRTPFYAESGGQIGDQGTLFGTGIELKVSDTTKSGGTFWHQVEWPGDPNELIGVKVTAQVDESRRNRIRRNHTATHLLHAALRQTLGGHVAQAGSYVGPDGLRFDFTHGKGMSPEEVARVERMVNEQALANTPVVTYVDIPIAEARAKGAMALFGEKYGDKVRMVEVGDFSRELCGGVHVSSTGELGLFKIQSESSAASGIRRVEAITGEAAYEWVLDETSRLKEAAGLLKATPKELVSAVGKTLEQLREEKRKREKAEVAALRGTGKAEGSESDTTEINGLPVWVKNFGEVDPKIAASELDNAAAGKPLFLGLVAVTSDGKVNLFAKAGAEAIKKGAHAGNLVREVAKLVGGGGGGRPDFATAGGREPSKVAHAIEQVPEIVRQMTA
ncbi:MAG TPA: alanine--tRNA ligase [Fimbriimonas sp.]|nr:alanine--tRNA ligase [Fimbriimonas sp.]